jgi:hypothetical protein
MSVHKLYTVLNLINFNEMRINRMKIVHVKGHSSQGEDKSGINRMKIVHVKGHTSQGEDKSGI